MKKLHFPFVMSRIILVMALVFAGTTQASAGWFHYYLSAVASPSEGGTVYASKDSSEPSASSYTTSYLSSEFRTYEFFASQATINVYYFAKANAGYDFVGWQDESGNIVSTEANATFTFTGEAGFNLFNLPTYTIKYTAVFKRTASEVTLLALASDGVTDGYYKVFGKNLRSVDHFTAHNGDKYLVVRDDDNYSVHHWINTTFDIIENAHNMLKDEAGNEIDQRQYVQANWALVKVHSDEDYDKVGVTLNSIVGTLTDNYNLVIDADSIEEGTEPVSEQLNTYTPLNFSGYTYGLLEVGDSTYFFMPAKRCELAEVTWLVYAADGNFYLPADEKYNPNKLAGGVKPVWDYNTNGDVSAQLVPGATYKVTAIVKEIESSASAPRKATATPYTEGGISSVYEIYPINITDADAIVTAVTDVETAKQVQSVSYYDLSGRQSSKPFGGINVVVTRYTDGTTATSKMLK